MQSCWMLETVYQNIKKIFKRDVLQKQKEKDSIMSLPNFSKYFYHCS